MRARRIHLLLLGALICGASSMPTDARAPRNRNEVRDFRYLNPCPATGQKRGACPGWQVDHIEPLCAGGADTRENMQWIRTEDHKMKTFLDSRRCRAARIR